MVECTRLAMVSFFKQGTPHGLGLQTEALSGNMLRVFKQ